MGFFALLVIEYIIHIITPNHNLLLLDGHFCCQIHAKTMANTMQLFISTRLSSNTPTDLADGHKANHMEDTDLTQPTARGVSEASGLTIQVPPSSCSPGYGPQQLCGIPMLSES